MESFRLFPFSAWKPDSTGGSFPSALDSPTPGFLSPSLKWERTWVQEPKEPGRVFPGGWAPRMLGAGGRAAPAGALCGAASPTARSHVHLADGSCSENKTCSLDLLIK